jgi:hypothetical protein
MASRAGSNRIVDLESADKLEDKDEFLFFQNSTKKTKKVTRSKMLSSPGVATSLGITPTDTTAPSTPTGLTVTTATEKGEDGTERVYIRAVLANANTESDLDSYGWSIRRVSGTPVFDGSGNLTGYGGTGQIFGPIVNITPKTDSNALKMQWDVKANTWYEVKVCAVDKTGNISAFTALNNTNDNGVGNPAGTVILSGKDTTPPAAPTSVAATSAIKSVFLSWTNPTDADLAYINIYRNTSNTPPTIGTTTPYAKIMSNSYVDSNTSQGTTYYYWLTSVDDSGNETATTSTVVSIQPGLVANTDITTFAVDATKMFTNTVILKADVWTDNSNNGTLNSAPEYIHWNAHTLVYGGASYSISAGSTNLQFVYWTGGTTYQTSDTNPTLTDGQFMIATNAKNSSGVATGLHDLAWNAIANAVIGSAYIQNAAITNAKVNDLAVDKLTSGSISAQTISLIGDSIIKSSSATSIDVGSGLWIKGLAGGGSEFGIGDLAGTNYGYLKWKTSTNTLSIKGAINATSLTLNGSALTGGDVGLGNVQNLSAANQTITGLESTITINSGGIAMGTGGFVRGAINWDAGTSKFTTSSSGFFLGYTTGSPTGYKFFLGETGTSGLGGNAYLYWNGSSLAVKGTITATSLTLSGFQIPTSDIGGLAAVATSGSKSDVGLGNVSNLTPQNQAQTGIEAAITIASGGIAMNAGGYVRGNIAWATDKFTINSNGFYLGYTSDDTSYKLFVGQTGSTGLGGTNYLYWNGSTLKIGGNIVGGSTVGSGSDAAGGLIINSPIGIRTANSNQTLTITGGTANGNTNGAQIDFSGNGLADGNRGVLVLQGGAVGNSLDNGRIDFRTNTSDTSNVGVLRASIRTNGELIVYKNASWNGSSYIYTSGSGCGQFNGNLSVGMNFDSINSSGNTSGKLWVATEIAVYNSSTRNIVLTGSSGDVTAVQFTTSSSRKLKTNIKKLKSGVSTIENLNPVSYKRKGAKNKKEIGLIAEEVNEIIPDIVKKDAKNNPEGIDYSKLTVILINAVKELSAEVKELKKKVK